MKKGCYVWGMTDELITFETARMAKEKGFIGHGKIGSGYDSEGLLLHRDVEPDLELIAAPTQSLLQRWLRENKRSQVNPVYQSGKWAYMIEKLPSDKDIAFAASGECQDGDLWLKSEVTSPNDWWKEEFDTYEAALEAGLQEALGYV